MDKWVQKKKRAICVGLVYWRTNLGNKVMCFTFLKRNIRFTKIMNGRTILGVILKGWGFFSDDFRRVMNFSDLCFTSVIAIFIFHRKLTEFEKHTWYMSDTSYANSLMKAVLSNQEIRKGKLEKSVLFYLLRWLKFVNMLKSSFVEVFRMGFVNRNFHWFQ